jgi:hypothetical protein
MAISRDRGTYRPRSRMLLSGRTLVGKTLTGVGIVGGRDGDFLPMDLPNPQNACRKRWLEPALHGIGV